MSRLLAGCRAGWRASAVCLSTVMLGACANNVADQAGIACPQTQIAVPSDRIGHSDDDGNIRYIATIEKLISSCEVNGDHVAVDLAFNLKAERGPVFEEKPVSLTYYVATVDPKREIVDKQLLSVDLALQPEQAENVIREELTLHLPLSSDATGANYNLYLGFQPDRQP